MESLLGLKQAPPFLILLDIVLFIYIYYISREKLIQTHSSRITYICIFILSLFSFYDTDWFHYAEIYNQIDFFERVEKDLSYWFEKTDYLNIEKIYILIANYSGGSYLIFRSVIWGSATYCLYETFKRLCDNPNKALFAFVSIFLVYFCYARVSLAISLSYLGFSFLLKPKSKYLSYVAGVLLIAGSLLFHKSIGVLLLVLFLSIIPLSKKTLIIAISCIVPLFLVLSNIQSYIQFISISDNLVLSKLEYELDAERVEDSGSFLRLFIVYYLKYTPYYLFLIWQIRVVMTNKLQEIPNSIRSCSAAAIYLILISTVFLILGQFLFFYRILIFSMIPISIVLAYYNSSDNNSKFISAIYRTGLFMSFFTLLYSCYLSIMS